MAVELATAYVNLVSSAKGMGKDIQKQLGDAGDEGGKVGGDKAGKSLVGHLGGFLKKSVVGLGVAAGGLLATSLTKGISRLTNIENATAKLSGLGNSASTVSKVMDNALASVKGTAFGLDEAATTAAGVVAAGIKPGKELQGVLQTVADTATIAGKSMADTGAIFGSVAARGKLQGDDLLQLQSAGVPVLAMLAKHYGITAAAASQMVSHGEVDFKNFNAALQENLGGAALKSGETTQGALKNMWAAFGRFGAALAGPAFGGAQKFFVGITGLVDKMTTGVGAAVDGVQAKISGWSQKALDSLAANSWSDAFKAIKLGLKGVTDDDALDGMSGTLYDLGAAARSGFGAVQSAARTGLQKVDGYVRSASPKIRDGLAKAFALPPDAATSWQSFGTSVLGKARDSVTSFAKIAKDSFGSFIDAARPGFQKLWDAIKPLLSDLGPSLKIVLTALNPFKVIFEALKPMLPQIAEVLGQIASTIGSFLASALKSAKPLLDAVVRLFGDLMPFVQKLVASLLPPLLGIFKQLAPMLDAIFKALEPVIDAIAKALIPVVQKLKPIIERVFTFISDMIKSAMKVFSGLIDFVTGVFSGNWSKAWNGIKKIFSGIWDGIKNIVTTVVNGIKDFLKGAWDLIKKPAKAAWGVIHDYIVNPVKTAWQWVKDKFSDVAGWIDGAVTKITKGFRNAWNWIRDYILSPVKTAWNWVSDKFKDVAGWIGGAIDKVTGVFKKAWGFVYDYIVTPIKNAIQWVKDAIGALAQWMANNPVVQMFAPTAGAVASKAAAATGGGGGGFGGQFGGPRASGGPVYPGKVYVVGEKRPELFVPNTAGKILPKVPAGGGNSYHFNMPAGLSPMDMVREADRLSALMAPI